MICADLVGPDVCLYRPGPVSIKYLKLGSKSILSAVLIRVVLIFQVQEVSSHSVGGEMSIDGNELIKRYCFD